MTPHRVALVATCVLVVGCGEAVRAPITIVVDTDRARTREEQGRLLELRAGVQGDRAELASARVALEQARLRLEASARGPQRDAIAAEVKVLEACVRAGSDAVTADRLAEALAATEGRLLAAIAAAPPPPAAAPAAATPGAATPTATSTAPAAPRARLLLEEARRIAGSKAFALADLVGGAERLDRVEGLLSRGDAAADEIAASLRHDATTAVVDRPLLLRRYQRLNARAGRLADGPDRARVEGLLRDASNAISAGDVQAATAALSALAEAVGG